MVNIHNAILRGLNSIYLQCQHIPNNPKDIEDFALYVEAWAGLVHHHHSMEETVLFPRIESIARDAGVSGVMNANIEQHLQFQPGLEKLANIAKKVFRGESEYDWSEWKAILDEFAQVLRQHLQDEIDSLLDLEKLNQSNALREVYDQAVEGVVKSADVVSV